MRNKKYLTIISILTTLSFVIGFSYAYFTAIVIGNDTSSTHVVKTGKMELTYNGTNTIDMQNAVSPTTKSVTFTVTNMEYMFADCSSLNSLELISFDTTKVINMAGMFAATTNLNDLNLNNMNIDQVTWYDNMFLDTNQYITIRVGNPDLQTWIENRLSESYI